MAQHNTPKIKRIISDTSLKKYLHPINTKDVTTAAITIPFRFLKKLTSSNSLYFFKSKNINIPVIYSRQSCCESQSIYSHDKRKRQI